jgi:two-component system, OmpR family, copper resistance phosphate regulon response regulator CusR
MVNCCQRESPFSYARRSAHKGAATLAVKPERHHLILASMRLLIIEDEKRTAAHLKKGLSENGFTVDVAYDGSEGLQLACGGGYSLIVLDVMLPQQDGWTILEELRRSGVMTPVLFLTARDRVEDRVKGLEMGADDYLIKPYAFSELLARVRTILRRGSTIQDEVLRVADLEIDTRRHKAVRAGNNLYLTRREYVLLSLLARSAGEVVSRTRIVEEVWDINFDTGTNIVEATMRRLRAKVDDPFEKPLIHNVRGIGYVLESR